MSDWRPTPALLTATALAAGLLVVAVLSQNAGLVVLAAPLLIISIWSVLTRPEGRPRVTGASTVPRTHEEATQTWSLRLAGLDGAEIVDATTSCSVHVDTGPASGLLRALPSGDTAELSMRWAARRWGPAEVGTGSCVAFSTWSGYRVGPLSFRASRIQVTPAIPAFTATGGAPRPAGLVGQNRSQRRGDGTEFADIRVFQSGDRLRRIHWPISARTGQLHVRTTYAELDSEILLVLDAEDEYGDPAAHAETSLDIGVRSCAAMAAHLLQRGERVGLQVLSSVRPERVRSRGGSGQLRRILHELSGVRPGALGAGSGARHRIHASRGTLVVVVTPLVGTAATTLAAEAAQRGLVTVLVDSLPAATAAGDAAQRLSMLQRQVHIHRLQARGLAVVPWRGPGSLDPVLRRMGATGVGSRGR